MLLEFALRLDEIDELEVVIAERDGLELELAVVVIACECVCITAVPFSVHKDVKVV